MLPLGDVFVGCDPTAIFHRLAHDANKTAVGKLINPARDLVGGMLTQRAELLVDGAGILFALKDAVQHAMRNDRFVRCASPRKFRRQSIQAGVTLVADHQALVAVEHTQAVGHIFERRVEPLVGQFDPYLPANTGYNRCDLKNRDDACGQ